MIELAALNPVLSAEVVKRFADKKAAIVGGQFQPFTGPVKDQAGALKIAAGQAIRDADLWGMNWYVEGVDGKLP
ncbi:hypothetical protein [Aquabacterium sp.]|uniref:hypothetical protein n=1 Tax=Aquabacterium sp. TaxID=1872578 RepID=UPI003D6CA2CB